MSNGIPVIVDASGKPDSRYTVSNGISGTGVAFFCGEYIGTYPNPELAKKACRAAYNSRMAEHLQPIPSYRESEFGKRENIYIHTIRPYAWIWRAKTATGRISKYYHVHESNNADGFYNVRLPKLPKGYTWHGAFTYKGF